MAADVEGGGCATTASSTWRWPNLGDGKSGNGFYHSTSIFTGAVELINVLTRSPNGGKLVAAPLMFFFPLYSLEEKMPGNVTTIIQILGIFTGTQHV